VEHDVQLRLHQEGDELTGSFVKAISAIADPGPRDFPLTALLAGPKDDAQSALF
jgi:hypothetical protein